MIGYKWKGELFNAQYCEVFVHRLEIFLNYHTQIPAIANTVRTMNWSFVANNYVYLQFLSVRFHVVLLYYITLKLVDADDILLCIPKNRVHGKRKTLSN